jgi:alpha-mannosidase
MQGIQRMILAFGWGDGGGGPTRDHLEFLRRAANLEGAPQVKIASPAEFFADLPPHDTLPRYVGELYFQAHWGTYTTQARTKQANRKLEFALREAEFWGCVSRVISGHRFTPDTLKASWRTLLLHQFHDILPGSSIQRVYQEAEASLTSAIGEVKQIARNAASALISSDPDKNFAPPGYTVFNSLSWSRTVIIDLPTDRVEVTIPPCGWTSIQQDHPVLAMPPMNGITVSLNTLSSARAASSTLENEYLLARFNEHGELISLIEKSTQWEVMDRPGNRFCLFKDIPSVWDIDSIAELQPISTPEPVKLEVIDPGPLAAQLRLTRRLSQSTITQVITLRRGSHRLGFATTVDWQERHKLLKVAFPVNIHSQEALHEIQFGYLHRPNHRSRQYDADRFEVCNHKWSALVEEMRGVGILNDSKYGLSVDVSTIKLTLLRSPLAPDPQADRETQNFIYAIYPWTGPLAESHLVQEAYELNTAPFILPGMTKEASLFQLDHPNIILDTLKPAEDGSSDLILRFYESMHSSTQCTMHTSFSVHSACECDMLENAGKPLECSEQKLTLDFRPFEIKTVRLII